MSRYKEHRDQRHRRFDDSFPRDPGESPFPSPFQQRESVAQPVSGPPTDATVKWFNAEQGFGFVQASDGSEAFLHIRQLEAAGHTSLPEGSKLSVRHGRGQKGPQVTEVLEVDTSTATPAAPRSSFGGGGMGGPRAPRPQRDVASGPAEERQGTVKWSNPDKGYGFIAPDGGGKDIFVHVTALERSGVINLTEGQRLVVQVVQGQKGLEARSVQPLD
jgi:CspA family cold shock protein